MRSLVEDHVTRLEDHVTITTILSSILCLPYCTTAPCQWARIQPRVRHHSWVAAGYIVIELWLVIVITTTSTTHIRDISTMADREDKVYKAKLAEQAERYDGEIIPQDRQIELLRNESICARKLCRLSPCFDWPGEISPQPHGTNHYRLQFMISRTFHCALPLTNLSVKFKKICKLLTQNISR